MNRVESASRRLASAVLTCAVALVALVGWVPAADAASTYYIAGKVTLPAGAPSLWLQGLDVEVSSGSFERSVPVNSTTGQYAISGLPADEYVVKFSVVPYWDAAKQAWTMPNLIHEWNGDSLTEAKSTKVKVGPSNAANVNASLALGATISGTMTLPWSDWPAYVDRMKAQREAVTVWAYSKDLEYEAYAWIDKETGKYTMSGLVPGTYIVWFQADPEYFDPGTGVYESAKFMPQFYPSARWYEDAVPVTVGMGGAKGIDATFAWTSDAFTGTISLPFGAPTAWLSAVDVWATDGQFSYPGVMDPVTGEYKIGGLNRQSYYQVYAEVGSYYDAELGEVVAPSLKTEYYGGAYSPANAKLIAFRGGTTLDGLDVALDFTQTARFTTSASPTITGTVAVGSPLTASPGAWSPTPEVFACKWYRDGVAISSANDCVYTPNNFDAGHQLSVVMTGGKINYQAVTKASARVAVPLQTFSSKGTVAISGTPAPGLGINVEVSGWSPNLDWDLSYCRWFRDGVAIPGATGCSYALSVADVGHQFSATVNARKSGYESVLVATPRVTAEYQTFRVVSKPVISRWYGQDVLEVVFAQWEPTPYSVKYQWYRDGVSIPGATSGVYELTSEDFGRQISVVVTASGNLGFRSSAVASSRVTVNP